MVRTAPEKPITCWSDLSRELKESTDPSHSISIISRALTNPMHINNLAKWPQEELNRTVRWAESLKIKIIGFFSPH